jgi:hypothetical protein
MLEADPSARKGYVPWLCRVYLKDKLALEDLSAATETLVDFEKKRHELNLKIDDYLHLRDLSLALSPEKGPQTLTLVDTEKAGVVVPLSREASEKEGLGTKWCTSGASSTSSFWAYAANGPLLIVHTNGSEEKRKYLIDFHTDQFHDELEKDIPLDVLKLCFPEVRKCLEKYQRGKEAFGYEKKDAPAAEAKALQPLPEQKGDACYFTALREGKLASFAKVPPRLLNEGFYREAVAYNGLLLRHVPKKFHTDSLWRSAVKQNGAALEHVPEEERDYRMYLDAVRTDWSRLSPVFLPEGYRTDEIYEEAWKHNPEALYHFPQRKLSRALCLETVERLVEKAKESGGVPNLVVFKNIPNKWQDSIARAAGLGFDKNGFLTIRDVEEAPARPPEAPAHAQLRKLQF